MVNGKGKNIVYRAVLPHILHGKADAFSAEFTNHSVLFWKVTPQSLIKVTP
jgi:hypothetical protein